MTNSFDVHEIYDFPYIYPTTFEEYFLKTFLDKNGHKHTILINCNGHKKRDLKLGFSNIFYNDIGSLFSCELVSPRNCNDKKQYLMITDISFINGQNMQNVIYDVRFQFVKQILKDSNFFDCSLEKNDFILFTPNIMVANEIEVMNDIIIPNHFLNVKGIAFTNSKPKNMMYT